MRVRSDIGLIGSRAGVCHLLFCLCHATRIDSERSAAASKRRHRVSADCYASNALVSETTVQLYLAWNLGGAKHT